MNVNSQRLQPPASRASICRDDADLSSETRAALLVQQVLRNPSVRSGVDQRAALNIRQAE
jgi:hypothetical protein